ncbi:unnamed protein product [Adineta steineri]|uniref:G-protein coupled receptors family 1 profile domain-containing protein n=1 Tax=Adineta steineri TaxID=433720 RepID=A0A813WB93_9BILA|nr:unnamed protein product [Adineta steineri]CAF4033534.1 unnamed protein product [Adineta steineri]
MVNNIGFTLNSITLCINIFTCGISLIILTGILYYLRHNRMKKDDRITVILCANIYTLIFLYTIILMSFNIQAILGQLYAQDFNSPWCLLMGYFAAIFLSMVYWSFANQAFFRLCRIVYSNIKWLQYFWLYIVIPPVEFILVCLLLCPILLWHDIVYLSSDYYCNVANKNIRGIVWLLSLGYGTPLLLLLFIYIYITIYIYRQMNTQTLIVKQRQQRDLVVIRRILITVVLLIALQIPRIVLLIMLFITKQEYTFFARIEWLFISFSMIGLCLSMAIFTPQLRSIILKKFRPSRLVPITGTLAGTLPSRPNNFIE